MDEKETLTPTPCGCGGKLDIDYEHYDIESDADWFVECLGCGVKIKAKTRKSAIEKWNKHLGRKE